MPSGRVGNSKDALFRSNEHFREAVAERETFDILELEKRLDRHLDKAERARIGVTQLRRFLEQLLQRRYLENVPAIVPLLEREYRSASAKLEATQEELNDLQPDKLKEKGRSFREVFLAKLQLLLKGTVSAPPERFGETLADEHIRGGRWLLLYYPAHTPHVLSCRSTPPRCICITRWQGSDAARGSGQRTHASVWWRPISPRRRRVQGHHVPHDLPRH